MVGATLSRAVAAAQRQTISPTQMTKQLCVTALHQMEVDVSLGRGDRISENIFLTNDKALVAEKITPPMMAAFGSLEMNAIRHAGVVAYRIRELEEEPSATNAEHALVDFLHELKQLQLALWLIRDNAVYMENAFLQWPHGRYDSITSMNFWGAHCSTSDGTRTSVTFTRAELRVARQLHQSLWVEPTDGEFTGDEPTQPDISRLSRALYFIQAAREAPALSLKIAMYCSAFEALLSTEASELAHKLAERISWLTAASPEKRLNVFKRVKAAYAIRSKTVHGSVVKQAKLGRDLLTAARDCDEIARALLAAIGRREELSELYRNPSTKPEELEDALLRVTLDTRPSGAI
jgi:hypothetical protein